jgi:Cu-Zn family superoxide dismutase
LFIVSAAIVGATGTASASPVSRSPHFAFTSATFESYQPEAKAVTYNSDEVKVGAHVSVIAVPNEKGTTVALFVKGLLPNETYGAHAHEKACGTTGAAAGPHFQHVPDPVQPSVDPAYANLRNEVWLDLTTDGRGNGFAVTGVDWRFSDRRAESVVLHAEHTSSHPGHAGTAGARLACVNIDF